jgi:hypothetical protein
MATGADMAKKASEKKTRSQKKEQSPLLVSVKRKSRAKRVLEKSTKTNISARHMASQGKAPAPSKIKSSIKKDFVDCCELPTRYDRTGVTLIAKDPSSVYAYWEITSSSIQEARSKLKGAFNKSTQTLRMFDVAAIDVNGANAIHQFDVDIDSSEQSRYIVLPNDKATVCVHLGYRTPTGAFYPLARSNIISTPSADASDQLEITWAKVLHKQGAKPCMVTPTFSPSFVPAETIQNSKGAVQFCEESKAKPSNSRNAPIGAPELGGKENDNVLSMKTMQIRGLDNHTSNASISGDTPDFGLMGDLRNNDAASSYIMPLFGVDEKTGFSADLQNISSESNIQGGASEQMQRGFFFQLDAELIVYGRTETGAKVSIDGQDIELRDDGTFTQRLAFPEGALPLDFLAHSADGRDRKRITLSVQRTTNIHL